jgi:hypothetical protein
VSLCTQGVLLDALATQSYHEVIFSSLLPPLPFSAGGGHAARLLKYVRRARPRRRKRSSHGQQIRVIIGFIFSLPRGCSFLFAVRRSPIALRCPLISRPA